MPSRTCWPWRGCAGSCAWPTSTRLAITNLNRIPASLLDIGINKTVSAARRIAEIDPYLPVSIWPSGVTNENVGTFLDGLDLVIEECDSLDIKVLLREAARDRRIPVIMETSDRGLLDVERYDLEPDRTLFHGLLAGISTRLDRRALHARQGPLRPADPRARPDVDPGAASLAEVGKTLSTWPQLGGDVTLGAATTAAAVLRLVRDGDLPSGRLRVDLDAMLDDARCTEPDPAAWMRRRSPPPRSSRPRTLVGSSPSWRPGAVGGQRAALAVRAFRRHLQRVLGSGQVHHDGRRLPGQLCRHRRGALQRPGCGGRARVSWVRSSCSPTLASTAQSGSCASPERATPSSPDCSSRCSTARPTARRAPPHPSPRQSSTSSPTSARARRRRAPRAHRSLRASTSPGTSWASRTGCGSSPLASIREMMRELRGPAGTRSTPASTSAPWNSTGPIWPPSA